LVFIGTSVLAGLNWPHSRPERNPQRALTCPATLGVALWPALGDHAGVFIHPVTDRDADAIVALWREVFPEYDDPTRPQRDPRASIARKLAFGDGLFWLAKEEALILGTVMAGYDGHRGWIYSLGVHPQRRRTGVGRALVAEAERALLALGCPKVNVQVFSSKPGAQAFWRSVGYEPDAVIALGKRLG
jgi:ribosomal protein S18 acetylase RimI-like enzyme